MTLNLTKPQVNSLKNLLYIAIEDMNFNDESLEDLLAVIEYKEKQT